MIENIIIANSDWQQSDCETLFGNEEIFFAHSTEMSALLKDVGVYKSTSESRRAGRVGPVPVGFTTDYKASKTRRLWIWNPRNNNYVS
jgi:hypothetical protein